MARWNLSPLNYWHTRRQRLAIFAIVYLVAVLVGCATQPPRPEYTDGLPGFWSGLLHGFLIFFTFIGGLFSDSYRIYAFPNSGSWYDFGYLMGASAFLGGGGASQS